VSHPLAERMRSARAEERRAACAEAAEDPAGALLTDPLAEALGDADSGVARAAARSLARLARQTGGPDAALRDALRGDDLGRRIFAAFAFAEIEPPGPRIVPALVGGLAHADGSARWHAARLLVDAGRVHPEVFGMLLGLVGSDERVSVRRMAAFCVRELAPDLPEAARTLVAATHDPDVHVRRAALTGLSGLMDPPDEVRRRLAAVHETDPDETARHLAQRALDLLDGPAQSMR
jgi:HEAT repeat protein